MAKFLISQLMSLSLLFNAVAHTTQVPSNAVWEKKDMDPRVNTAIEAIPKIDKMSLLPEGTPNPGDPHCNAASPCTFDLFYFMGEAFNGDDANRKNILYIPGGPGQFLPENTAGSRALSDLAVDIEHINGRHNVIYFHLRGAGQSSINQNNKYDQFLRTQYVIEDIEKLRKKILNNKPWDAIYAHSWGTVVAQRYAAIYGKKNNPSSDSPTVKSLILSAPVVRRRVESLKARNVKTISNLRNIYNYYRPTELSQGCACVDPSYLESRLIDFSLAADLEETDNLCFLTRDRIKIITEKVESALKDVETNYGSIDFVMDNFQTLQKDQNFTEILPYPFEFFSALRIVQMSGAPDEGALVFADESKRLIDAALVVGYYATGNNPQTVDSPCDPNGQFLSGLGTACKNKYCQRLKALKESLASSEGLDSLRANYVFGVYDGVARWVFGMLGKEGECFTGQDVKNFTNGPADKKKYVRDQAKKIGIVPGERICPWDPEPYAHEVPTLILKGSADTIIAGCQAEDFFNGGLKDGRRMFLEFRGMGHNLSVSNTGFLAASSDQTKAFGDLIEEFIKTSPDISQFRNKIQAKLTALRAFERTPSTEAPCDPLKP